MTFEEFLEAKFFENYHGTKDDFETTFDRWLSELDVGEVISFAEEALKLKQ